MVAPSFTEGKMVTQTSTSKFSKDHFGFMQII